MCLLLLLKHKHNKTAGHCGVTLPEMRLSTGATMEDIKKALRRLYDAGKITHHKGKDGVSIKLKTN